VRGAQYILPFFLSVAIHAGVFFTGSSGQSAQVAFDPGLAAVRVRLMPSIASPATTPHVDPEPAPPAPPAPQPLAPPIPPAPDVSELPAIVEDAEPEQVAEVEHVDPPEAIEPAEPLVEAAPQPQELPKPAEPAEIKEDIVTSPKSVACDGDMRESGVTPAEAIGLNRLEYPRLSRRLGQQGTVVVEVQVLPTGRAGEVRIVETSRYKRLDRAVVSHMRKCRFRPARNGRRAIASVLRIPYKFELTDPS